MRNRLIHAYYDVDLDRVWDTLTVDLPGLIDRLRSALAAAGEPGEPYPLAGQEPLPRNPSLL